MSVQCSGQMGGLLYGIYFPVCTLYVLNFELLINDNTQAFSVTVRRSVVRTTDEGDLYSEGSVAIGVDCGRSLVVWGEDAYSRCVLFAIRFVLFAVLLDARTPPST